jgi:N-acyl-D-amino-acid deacylase
MRRLCLPLALLALAPCARADAPGDPVKAAIEKGLRRIETGAASYVKNRDCFSCHHQAMSILSLSAARRHGFEVEPAKLRQQVDFTVDFVRARKDQVAKGRGLAGGNTMAAYALFALEAGGQPADENTSALVEYLLTRQQRDGSWPALTTKRPPTEGSPFTNAALALHSLRAYTPAKDAREADDLRNRIERALAKGKDWLLAAKPESMEDKGFHLRGLVYAGAAKEDLDAARKALLAEQKEDGSWAQAADLAGDAYATGTVLVALRQAGLAATDPAYQKGVKYLLATQRDDGAWVVQTRSKPVQVFFDNGDPGGKSQFISFVATNWAVLALLETLPEK